MTSSEYSTEHSQPTIEYGTPYDNSDVVGEIPEIMIVGESESDEITSEAHEEVDTSTITGTEDRDYDDVEQPSVSQPSPVSEEYEEEAETEADAEPAPERLTTAAEEEVPVAIEFEEEDVPVLVPRQIELPKRDGKTIGEIAVEKLLDYLDDQEPAATDEKPEPVAAADAAVEASNDTAKPEEEDVTVTEVPAPAAEDNSVAPTEIADETVTQTEPVAEEETVLVDLGLGEQPTTSDVQPTEAKDSGDAKSDDIRDLVGLNNETTPEASTEATEDTDVVVPAGPSPLSVIISQLPTPEVPQPVMQTSETVNEETVEVQGVDERGDIASEMQPNYAPPVTTTSPESSRAYADEGDSEVSVPVASQNPQFPKLGPELPAPPRSSRLTRILEGIGTGAAIAGTLTAAGFSAGSLPVRLAMTKIDDKNVKHKGLFTYEIIVQGPDKPPTITTPATPGKTQKITVTSPFGRTYAKFQARIKFARDNLAL